jgi:L-seryl-tRNA(Ser) seleniumtransferase
MSDSLTNHEGAKRDRLRNIPSISELLQTQAGQDWRREHPAALVVQSLRKAVEQTRDELLHSGLPQTAESCSEMILKRAGACLKDATRPHIRRAINATGIILHTGLGRAVFSSEVIDSVSDELKGCCTLALDVTTGERAERDELVEYILTELTGAEAATVVNNNAAATLLVLAALARGREVIVSRGQLIEIGGSFRLPEVMSESGARLVEVGATNRTHLQDYRKAVTPDTVALMRVHPSNYRIVGFTKEVPLEELAGLARERNLLLIDDLGAGALIDLERFGLPHEPTVLESIRAGADLALFSGDKLIGGSQAGIIVGRRELIQRLRKSPLMRAVRPDKTCLMILERTLAMFRDPERTLTRSNPTYRMLSAPLDVLRARAETLAFGLREFDKIRAEIGPGVAFLGSGSLPTEAIPSLRVSVDIEDMTAQRCASALRMDDASVFARIESERVHLDMRTLEDHQVPLLIAAFRRILSQPPA